jgi:hypothetical protein
MSQSNRLMKQLTNVVFSFALAAYALKADGASNRVEL